MPVPDRSAQGGMMASAHGEFSPSGRAFTSSADAVRSTAGVLKSRGQATQNGHEAVPSDFGSFHEHSATPATGSSSLSSDSHPFRSLSATVYDREQQQKQQQQQQQRQLYTKSLDSPDKLLQPSAPVLPTGVDHHSQRQLHTAPMNGHGNGSQAPATPGGKLPAVRAHQHASSEHYGIYSDIGGYDIIMAEGNRKHNLGCPLCKKILREPIQTTCGDRFCKTCLDEAVRLNQLCPMDQEKLAPAFLDRHCQREIDCLSVKCQHHSSCPWRGQLKDLESHLSVCPFQPLPCPNPGCGKTLPRNLLQQHATEGCAHRRVSCSYCGIPIAHCDYSQHIKRECPDYPVQCPNGGCEQQVTRSTLQHHREVECGAATQQCQLGCGREVVRKEADNHIAEGRSGDSHTRFILGQLEDMRKLLTERDLLIERQQFELKLLRGEMEDLITRKVDTLARTVAQRSTPSSSHSQFGGGDVFNSHFQQRVEDELSSLGRRVRETANKLESVQAIAENQTSLCEELTRQTDQLDLRVMELETTAYGGFLIWKIPRFSKLLQDGKNGTKTSHYSQPFYCGRYGYKACARVYPNGDGAGHGKYVSLFFSVMAGDFDAILPWPFQRRVTLTVLDQSPSRRHISETFSPDVRSSSFQRPTTGMNVASGCPCFIAHDLLTSTANQYLKDDTLFLKIAVDITSMANV